jgi:hypothetical protein
VGVNDVAGALWYGVSAAWLVGHFVVYFVNFDSFTEFPTERHKSLSNSF